MPAHSVYAVRINNIIARLHQSGLITKLFTELQAELLREKRMRTGSATALLRAPTAKQLRVDDAEERGLTVADTEGMFLLMGCGYGVALALLLSEMVGGFTNRCRRMGRLRREQRQQEEADAAADEEEREHTREMATMEMGNTNNYHLGGGQVGDRIATVTTTTEDGIDMNPMRCSSTGKYRKRRLRNNSLATTSAVGYTARHHSGDNCQPAMRTVPTFHIDRVTDDDGTNGGKARDMDVNEIALQRAPTPFVQFEEGFGEIVGHDDDNAD